MLFFPATTSFCLQVCALFLPGLGLTASAQDTILTRDGRTQEVKVLGANGSSVQAQVEAGTVAIPLARIVEVKMAAPPGVAAARAALAAGDLAKALAAAKSVVAAYRGLPAPWAQEAAGMLGDIHVAMNDLASAEAAYREYQKLYPGAAASGSARRSDIGLARIAIAKNDLAAAKQKLGPILARAGKESIVPPESGALYGQAFLLSGRIREAAGDPAGALEDYLRTVTLFPHDHAAVAEAQKRAGELRREHGVVVP